MSLEAPSHAVDDLLAALAEALGDDADRERLDELGDRADEIVSTTDLSDLVAAIGLGGHDQPQSLPAAVAAGGPRDVATLRSLLTAAKLPTADDEQRGQLVDELESLVETADAEPPDEGESTETEDKGESDSTETAPEAEAEEEAESAETANDTDEAESEDTGSVRQLLESQLQDTFDIFDDGLDVKGLTDGLTDDEDESTETETETESESTETEDEGETESTETAPEAEAEEEAESTETADDTDTGEAKESEESEDTGSIRQLLESQLQDTLDIFDDGLDVDGLTDGLTDDEDEKETEAETDDSEPSEETDNEKDQSTQSRDGTRWRPGGRGRTTHSTIPTAGRRDIGHSGQYSSIRGSTVSKR